MSKNYIFKILTLYISISFIFIPNLHAAAENEQQLSSEERAEEYRQSKPKIAERKAIRAALKALRSNGALDRASRRQLRSTARSNTRIAAQADTAEATTSETEAVVVAIKHVLLCETEANCQTAHDWANNNNFSTNGVLNSEGHGGEIMYHLFLRQQITPDEDTISSESSRLHDGIQTLDGIRYATWMVDLDPDGEQDNSGGNQ